MELRTSDGDEFFCLPDNAMCGLAMQNPEGMDSCPGCCFDAYGDVCVPDMCMHYTEPPEIAEPPEMSKGDIEARYKELVEAVASAQSFGEESCPDVGDEIDAIKELTDTAAALYGRIYAGSLVLIVSDVDRAYKARGLKGVL